MVLLTPRPHHLPPTSLSPRRLNPQRSLESDKWLPHFDAIMGHTMSPGAWRELDPVASQPPAPVAKPVVPPLPRAPEPVVSMTVEHAWHAARVASKEDRERKGAEAQAAGVLSTRKLRNLSREVVVASAGPPNRQSPRTRQRVATTAGRLSGALTVQGLMQERLSPEAFADVILGMDQELLDEWLLTFGSCIQRLGSTMQALLRAFPSVLAPSSYSPSHFPPPLRLDADI